MATASTFVGRTAELDRLAEALEALEPRAIQVLGPAGIGKTRLLAELARRAEERGHIALSGAGCRARAGPRPLDVRRRARRVRRGPRPSPPRTARRAGEQLAATKPLVLILDDFHWADPASVDLLVALLHRPPAAGVLLAVAPARSNCRRCWRRRWNARIATAPSAGSS